jgi:hypothetical protein
MLVSLLVNLGILALSIAVALAVTFAVLSLLLPLMKLGRDRLTRDRALAQPAGSRPGRHRIPSVA